MIHSPVSTCWALACHKQAHTQTHTDTHTQEMYWSRIFTTAMAAGVFVPSRGTTSTTATAFAPAPVSSFRQRPSSYFPPSVSSSPSQSTMVRMVGSGTGWDNHNFLDSLGRGPEDRQKANDDYFSQSRFGVGGQSLSNQNTNDDDESYSSTNDNDDDIGEGIRGAQITQDMKAKMKSVHTPEEERFQGGQMFRRVLEKAQTAAPSLNVPPSPTAPPPPIPRTPVSPTNMSLEQMTVEEQAQMFRQMMMMQQQQQQQQQPPPVTPPTTRYQPPPLEPMRQQYPRDDNRCPPMGNVWGGIGMRMPLIIHPMYTLRNSNEIPPRVLWRVSRGMIKPPIKSLPIPPCTISNCIPIHTLKRRGNKNYYYWKRRRKK